MAEAMVRNLETEVSILTHQFRTERQAGYEIDFIDSESVAKIHFKSLVDPTSVAAGAIIGDETENEFVSPPWRIGSGLFRRLC
ncbi:MAG: hypothetical protein ABIF77_01900 [bacterium]